MTKRLLLDDSVITFGAQIVSHRQPATAAKHSSHRKGAKLSRRVRALVLIALSMAAWTVIILALLPFLWG